MLRRLLGKDSTVRMLSQLTTGLLQSEQVKRAISKPDEISELIRAQAHVEHHAKGVTWMQHAGQSEARFGADLSPVAPRLVRRT